MRVSLYYQKNKPAGVGLAGKKNMVNQTQFNGYTFINTTPHDVRVVDENDNVILFVKGAPKDLCARAQQTNSPAGQVAGIPLAKPTYGAVENLPDPAAKTLYIVSTITVQAVQARAGRPVYDLLVPDTGNDCIRENGQPWAVRRFLTLV